MPKDHPYIELYNQKKIIFCVGQGAWEEEGVRTLRHLQSVFENKGIHAWCDFWGYDVAHDWPWWFKQIRYFVPILLND
jgi:esterase/lipase superfamily enzyme